MLRLNKHLDVEVEDFHGSKIYYIHDFYRDVDAIKSKLDNIEPDYFKKHHEGSNNGVFFEDRRHKIKSDDMKFITKVLSNLCEQRPVNDTHFLTNVHRFKKVDFNDYHDHLWWPHKDTGYNALIFLNKDDKECGTNLYEMVDDIEYEDRLSKSEHGHSWRKKERWKVLKHIEPEYNMCVLFDGLKFWHGMNICNDRYFGDEYRINQFVQFRP